MKVCPIIWTRKRHGWNGSLIAAFKHYGWFHFHKGNEASKNGFLFNFRVGPVGFAFYRSR